MPHDPDPGIPTLTQRAEPTLATDDTPNTQDPQDELPVLTDIDDSSEACMAGGVGMPQAAFSTVSDGVEANMTVLRTALQAELEQALQLALDDAAAGVRARLEAELPTLIARALSKVRPG